MKPLTDYHFQLIKGEMGCEGSFIKTVEQQIYLRHREGFEHIIQFSVQILETGVVYLAFLEFYKTEESHAPYYTHDITHRLCIFHEEDGYENSFMRTVNAEVDKLISHQCKINVHHYPINNNSMLFYVSFIEYELTDLTTRTPSLSNLEKFDELMDPCQIYRMKHRIPGIVDMEK